MNRVEWGKQALGCRSHLLFYQPDYPLTSLMWEVYIVFSRGVTAAQNNPKKGKLKSLPLSVGGEGSPLASTFECWALYFVPRAPKRLLKRAT